MKRRALLATAALGGGAILGGCLDEAGESDDGNGSEPPTGSSGETPAGDCGPAADPLSELLGDDSGDLDACFEGATPDLVVENGRGDALAATVAVDDVFEESYDLEPGERAIERGPFEAAAGLEVTVTLEDGIELTESWDERSCYRHGVAITDDGLEVGWVEPLQGPGDTQHDCYPGSDAPLEVGNVGEPRTVTVTIEDRCAGTSTTETLELEADDGDRLDGLLESGGVYDVTVDVEGGEAETYEFHEGCWGVSALVDEDGGVRIGQLGID